MRTIAPGAENGPRAESRESLVNMSVSNCLRLEFIAILSGPVSSVGNVSGAQL